MPHSSTKYTYKFKVKEKYIVHIIACHLLFLIFEVNVIYRDGELSTRDLQKMVQALPQYNEQMEKLSLHVEVGLFLC